MINLIRYNMGKLKQFFEHTLCERNETRLTRDEREKQWAQWVNLYRIKSDWQTENLESTESTAVYQARSVLALIERVHVRGRYSGINIYSER